MKYAVLILLCTLAPMVLADTPLAPDAPRSPLAVDAQVKHDATVKKAYVAYHDAIAEANAQLRTDLGNAMNAAMTNKNVDEVKRIDAAMARIGDDKKGIDTDAAPNVTVLSATWGTATDNEDVTAAVLSRLIHHAPISATTS